MEHFRNIKIHCADLSSSYTLIEHSEFIDIKSTKTTKLSIKTQLICWPELFQCVSGS